LKSQKEVIKFLPKKILKAGPNKGKEVYEEHAKDMIDAYVIAKGGK
jgi:preprotein translocase subunit Sec63